MKFNVTKNRNVCKLAVHFKKSLLIRMKLVTIILLVACLRISARGLSQFVTLSEVNAPLSKVFKEIKEQTGYLFLYTGAEISKAHPVTIEVKNTELEEVLEQCFFDQPFTYDIIEKTVVIKPLPPDLQPPPIRTEQPQYIIVTGRVTNEQGNPLASASVLIKGSTVGSMTDNDGDFTLADVEPNATLIISSIGYETKEIKVHGKHTLQITLKTKSNPLDRVQVIAYGTTTAKLSTGNITTVSAKEIEQQPVSNPLLALEGEVPGLFVTQSTGLPGSGVVVRVEGQNSISNGNDPLYVIDGVPYTAGTLTGLSFVQGVNYSSAGGGSESPLNFINPMDIESISVLKDADATAIYGSRAANGAILITTKKGVAGDTKVNVNVQDGWGHVSRYMSAMNTQQYLEMRREAFKNDGLTPGPTDYDINGDWDTTRNINWQKVLLGRSTKYQTASLSFSGGSATTQYRVSATFHKETTPFPSFSFWDQDGSMDFNINSSTPNQKLKFQLSANYMFDVNHLPSYDPTLNATQLVPDAPPLFNKNGSIDWALDSSGNTTFSQNPMYLLFYPDTKKTNNLVSHFLLSYQVLPGLEVKSSFGYTNQQGNEIQTYPLTPYLNNPQYLQYATRSANYENSDINSWIIEPQITYNKTIRKGKLEALAGATLEQNNSNSQQVEGTGYTTDLLLQDLAAAANVYTGYNDANSIYKYNAVFGRLNYNLQDKYIIDLTARRDGSSRFGPANEFHNFGAVGLSWIFSEENFIKNNLPFLSFGKLTTSYGVTGNDQIGDYQFMTLYSPIIENIPYQGLTGLAPNGLDNPYLQWESTRKLYFSTSLGFLKDKVVLNAGFSDNRSSNQLLSYSLPSITGFYGISRNLPATVQNTSWEFTLKTTNASAGKFSWTSYINLTIPRNKLISFPNFANSGYNSYLTIGKTITGFRVFDLLGVDPATGQFQFLGADGKPTFNPDYSSDPIVQVDIDPKFYGGFKNSFTFKGIELDFLFQFVKQDGRTSPFGDLPGYFYGGSGNQPVWVLNRWQKPGDKALNPPFSTYTTGNNVTSWFNGGSSQASYGDASYIRLTNASLSWQLPEATIKKAHIDNCQIFVHGQNIVTITKFRGLDPENQNVSGNGSVPPLRVITVGLQVGL